MDLKLYDTLSREKRVFKPIDPANVRMYVCGPTVYDFAHIGNARPVIVFDVLFRLLRHLYGGQHVTYVRNITDVDDKINARAAEEYPGLPLNDAIRQVTEKTEQQFRKDVDALGCLPPTVQPRATEHIAEMRDLIDRLVGSGNAYVAEEHVLFFVPSMHDYGKLAKRTLEEMIEGARVEVAPYKRDPMDFVLWKPSKSNEPHWPSPAGIKTHGRPGWHIECSAMSWKYLGEMFDIHGGGIDLVFPHHEDEIAQSRCAFHTPTMANYWMHNGFLQVEGQKMSKSLGNFVTIRDFLQNLPGDVLRLNMLRTHYRHPIDWTSNGVATALKELQTWTDLIALHLGDDVEDNVNFEAVDAGVLKALFDDLNTPLAISRLHKVFESAQTNPSRVVDLAATLWFLGFKNLNRPGLFHQGFAANLFASGPQIGPEEMRHVQLYRTGVANNFPEAVSASTRYLEAKGFIIKMNDAGVLFVGNKTSAEMQGNADPETQLRTKVQNWIELRSAARQAKNFAESDRIRNELAKMGVELEDHKDKPTTWKFKKAAS